MTKMLKLLVSVAFILWKFTCLCDSSHSPGIQTIWESAPVTLSEYDHVGSQEVFLVTVPSVYSSNFTVQWNSYIIEEGGGISLSCPDIVATVLIRKWSMPLPNPTKAAVPFNTLVPSNDTLEAHFTISQGSPNSTFVLLLSDQSDYSVDYYISIYHNKLDDKVTVDGLSKTCKYIAAPSVRAFSQVSITDAYMESQDQSVVFASFNATNITSLERRRIQLLQTQFITEKKGYNITLGSSQRFSWIIESFTDVGGILKLSLGMVSSDVAVKACVMWGLDFNGTYDSCKNGDSIELGSSLSANHWYWPFPKSGLWVVEVGLQCTSPSCDPIYTAYLDVDIIQCIDSCNDDKYQGVCRLYRTDVLFFSACDCKAGWEGIACSDDRNAIPHSKQVLMTCLLTLSNIIFLFSAGFAIRRGFYTEAIVYVFVLFFSTFYHACDQPGSVFLCIMRYDALQYSDFLGSVTAFWFTLIAVAALPSRLESFIHVMGVMAISVGVFYNRFSVWTTMVPILVGLVILAFKWGLKCKHYHSCYPKKRIWLLSLIPGILCAGIGLILFAFVETNDNYFYVHSMWHVLMGTSVILLLPQKKTNHENTLSLADFSSDSQYEINPDFRSNDVA